MMMLNNFQKQVMRKRFIHRQEITEIATQLGTTTHYVDKAIKDATTTLFKEFIKNE